MKTYRVSSSSHDRDRAARECRRLKAAKLFKKGIAQADIARRLAVTPAAVSQWHRSWKTKKQKGLHSLGKSGPKPKLTEAKLQKVRTALLRGPRAMGYATDIWTLERMRRVVQKKTQIRYGTTHIWRILTVQLGWSSQKPETRARERDERAIKQWKRWAMPQIKRGQKNSVPAWDFGMNRAFRKNRRFVAPGRPEE